MEKKNENGKVQLKGQLKLYIQWPAIMVLLLIAMDLWVYKMDPVSYTHLDVYKRQVHQGRQNF